MPASVREARWPALFGLPTARPPGSQILCMLPDTGERYLSTPLFDDIPVEMTAEETELAASTPGFRIRPSTADDSPVTAIADTHFARDAAVDDVESIVADPQHPVVVFALEWCEFCWSVRKLFSRYGIEYRSIDLDSVAYQKDDKGGQLRRALAVKTGATTIPQVFIAGRHIGGCTELFESCRDGTLEALLDQHGIPHGTISGDPGSFLPVWLHKR